MRILVLSAHTSSLFWFRMNMMQDFIKQGYTVYAAGSESEEVWRDRFTEKGIVYKQIRVQRNGVNPLKDLQTFFSIRALLKEISPEKIFAYQAKAIVYGALASLTYRRPDFYSLVAGLGSTFRGKSLKARCISWVLSAQYKIAFMISKAVIFQNRDDLTELLNRRLLSREKAHIINGSGVDIEKFPKLPMPEEVRFLFVGRLIKDKGIIEYLEASRIFKSKHPTGRCLLVGPYDTNPSALQPDELEPYVDDGTVEYYGEQIDVLPFLGETAVFVLPSYHEGTPKTVLEAMSTGRAVITTDAPGCRETVVDGENGFLVPVGDSAALASAMEKLFNDRSLCCRFGDIGREIAVAKYDVNKVDADIMRIMSLKKEKVEYVAV